MGPVVLTPRVPGSCLRRTSSKPIGFERARDHHIGFMPKISSKCGHVGYLETDLQSAILEGSWREGCIKKKAGVASTKLLPSLAGLK